MGSLSIQLFVTLFFALPLKTESRVGYGCGSDTYRKFPFEPDHPDPQAFTFPTNGTRGIKGWITCGWEIEPGAPWNAIRLEFTQFRLTNHRNYIQIEFDDDGQTTWIARFRSTSPPRSAITTPPGNVLRIVLIMEVEEDHGFSIELHRFQAAMWVGHSPVRNHCAHIDSNPHFYDRQTHSCFILMGTHGDKKDYDQAFEACGPGGHLAFVPNRQTFEKLEQHFRKYTTEHYLGPWIGLKQSNTTDVCEPSKCWSWMLPNGKYWDAERGKTAWMHGEPNGVMGNPAQQFNDCGALFYKSREGGKDGLNDDVCSFRKEYICQHELSSGCPRLSYTASSSKNGSIYSPGWPLTNNIKSSCFYVIQADRGGPIIWLTLAQLKVKATDNDTMAEIYNELENQPIAVWNRDTKTPTTIHSGGSQLIVRFYNGHSAARFHAVFWQTPDWDDRCLCNDEEELFLAKDGAFVNIHNAKYNCNERRCHYRVRASNGYKIRCLINQGTLYFSRHHTDSEYPELREAEDYLHGHRADRRDYTINSNNVTIHTEFDRYDPDRNISCQAVAFTPDCACPTPLSQPIESMSLWHDSKNCYLDCVFDLYPHFYGVLDGKYEIRLNYTAKIAGEAMLTLGSILEEQVYGVLVDTDSEWRYQKYPISVISMPRLYYHNVPQNGHQGFNLSYEWHKIKWDEDKE